MRRERLARAQAALKRHGIAAALLMRADNMRYTTSMRGHEFAPQLSYVLLFAEHEPIVYELGDQLGQQERYCPWIEKENWRYSYSWLGSIGGADAARDESRLFAEALVRDLKERGVYGEKLGFDNLDEVGRRALAEAGVELTGVMPAMMEARGPKTADEIACIRTAISIANSGFASLATFRPGLRERDAAAAAFDAMLRAGAEASRRRPAHRAEHLRRLPRQLHRPHRRPRRPRLHAHLRHQLRRLPRAASTAA